MRRPGTWLALLAVVLLATFAVARVRGAPVRVVDVTRRDLEQHIVASGRVWVPTRVQLGSQTSGLVIAVLAVEGAHVKAGDVLVQLDDAEAQSAVAEAKAARDQAAARVAQLRNVGAIVATESVRQAETNLEHAESDLARVQQLLASGSVARAELDNARRSVDLARAQKSAAEAQRIAAAPMGADSRVALTALMQAEAQLSGAKIRLAQRRLTAPQDAVVLTRSVEPGDVAQPSRTLMELAVDAPVQLVFQLDERNLSSVAVGQRARASADAFPQVLFDAEVSYLAPSIDPQRGSVEVRLRVPTAPPGLRPDMTVSVDLTVAKRERTLTVPSEAIRDAMTPAPWVFIVEDGRLARRTVTLGVRGEGATEILSGLDEGSSIAVADGKALTSGQRVRAVRD